MLASLPLACFLSMIRPPGVQFEEALLQIAPVNKAKCPYVRDTNDIQFRLYTSHNPTVYQELVLDDDEKLFASNLDYHAPTVIYFHAYMETTNDGSAARVRESYIIRGDTNIIMVDASSLEAGPWYFTAAENTWYIGKFAAKFIDYLVSRGLDLKKTHLIGHSLGAQAAGVAGYALKSGRVARITGLDPALPLFHGLPLEQRLDKSDAEFVDVIHTDGGIFGINHPLGHADFYPNGGISPQPGCELEVVIPQHLLLNKCENNTKPLGFYTFYLTPHESKSTLKLEKNLQKLFTKIHSTNKFKKNTHQAIKVGKKEGFTTEIIKDTKNQDLKEEDQIMTETVDKYYKIIPYFVAINKDDSNTGTMKPIIIKKIHDLDLNTENSDQETITIEEKPPVNLEKDTPQLTLNQNKLQTKIKLLETIAQVHEPTEDKSEPKSHLQETQPIQKENKQSDDVLVQNKDKSKPKTQQEAQSTQKDNQREDELEKKIQETGQTQKETKSKSTQLKNAQIDRVTRQKRFINPFQNSETEQQENFLFRILNFVFKHGRNIPVYSVMREINTLVKSGQGELNHFTKERNNFIGAPPPLAPVTYSLELGNESKAVAFMKRLLGLTPKGDRLTISGTRARGTFYLMTNSKSPYSIE